MSEHLFSRRRFASARHYILYLQSRGIKQSGTCLVSQKWYYSATKYRLFILFDQFMCFEKSEIMKESKMKKIKTACLSPIFVVHGSNHTLSLLKQDNAAWDPSFRVRCPFLTFAILIWVSKEQILNVWQT